MARGGWRRIGRRRFRYEDARGDRITDQVELERIRALAIPPAWQDVWISPSAGARLQATGIDAAGRKQYRYHERFRAEREREKFERLLDFGRRLPRFRARADRHLRGPELQAEWTCALATTVINKAWFRVGSERHARRSRTYGVTTLTKRHVTVHDDEVRFAFRAKNRRLVRRSIVNARVAGGIEVLLDLPGGSRLFRFERDDNLVPLTSPTLNAYLEDQLGDDFTAKDFRTWGGTLLAAEELERRGPATSESEAKRTLAAVMRSVGAELGNTPAVARASYVSPVVVDAFLAGKTIADYRPANGASRHLTVSESALMRLLAASARESKAMRRRG
jgi:DNA topoisomerase-1